MKTFFAIFAIIACCFYSCTQAAPIVDSCTTVVGEIYQETRQMSTYTVNPRDCLDIYNNGNHESGVYDVYVGLYDTVQYKVYCDMSLPGGGWTVILIRKELEGDTQFNFTRNWNDYVKGFGSFNKEYMMGLEQLHRMTRKEDQDDSDTELFIGLQNHKQRALRVQYCDIYKYAHYSKFSIGSSKTNYKLHVSGYDGTAGDSLKEHDGKGFSTYDNDNDGDDNRNCAHSFRGGWWYNDCHTSQLTGVWRKGASSDGIIWETFEHEDSMKSAIMAFRRVSRN